VGARTVTVAGLRTEIWYPAEVGSEAGAEKIRYDIREQLPDDEQGKIPDEDNPWQPCECFRDLPIDAEHGPYPLVLFLHGTAGFRTQSATFMARWASRGFIVVASDHPKLMLKDALDLRFGADQPGDAARVLDALEAPGGETEFLAGRIAEDRKAIAGHSAGGAALQTFGGRPGVRVLIPMAAGGVEPGEALQSTLILGAMDDEIVTYDKQQAGYESSPAAKRLVGLSSAGHLAFSDICFIGRDQGGLLQVAIDHGVDVNPLIASLAQDGCKEGQLPAERGWEIVNHVTSAALEERLSCSEAAAADLAAIQSAFVEIGEYREAL